MGCYVKRSYLVELVNQTYIGQEKNCYFCLKSNRAFCQTCLSLEEELRDKNFNTKNANVKKWFIIHFQKNNHKITVFPVSK